MTKGQLDAILGEDQFNVSRASGTTFVPNDGRTVTVYAGTLVLALTSLTFFGDDQIDVVSGGQTFAVAVSEVYAVSVSG